MLILLAKLLFFPPRCKRSLYFSRKQKSRESLPAIVMHAPRYIERDVEVPDGVLFSYDVQLWPDNIEDLIDVVVLAVSDYYPACCVFVMV